MTGKRVLDTVAQVQRDIAAMWTEPVEVTVARRGQAGAAVEPALHEMTLLPSAARPRLVASAGARAASAAAIARFSHSTGPAGRAARLAIAAAVRSGAADPLLRDRLRVVSRRGGSQAAVAVDHADSLLAELSEVFHAEVVVSMPVGAVRANRKPVLHVLTPGGRTLGFAKLGLSPLAGRLVETEAANLRVLAGAGLRRIELPQVVHEGVWSGHPLLVMTALATPLRRYHPVSRLPYEAMAELAAVGCVPGPEPLGESAWLAGLRQAAPGGGDPGAERFAALLDRLADRHGERPVRFGSWHGDWGPWNMAWARDRVRLWDWERFATGVPYGFDALHYALPQLPAERLSPGRLCELAAATLAPLGVAAADAPLVLALYVTALCARWLPDSRTEHGAPLRARVERLLDLLDALLDGTEGTDRADEALSPVDAVARPYGGRP